MIKILCSVYDCTLNHFSFPFCAQNEQAAIRDFGHACIDPQSLLSKSPSDFFLIVIGRFDDEDGSISATTHQTIANALQFSKKEIL